MSISKNLITLLICCYLALSPFIFATGFLLLSPFEFPKFIITIIFAELIAIFLFLKNQRINFDLLTKLIFLFLITVFLSNLLGLDPRISILGSPWRYQGFILLICGVIFYLGSKTIEKPNYLIKTLITTSILISLITIIQSIMLNLGYLIPNYNGRVVATLGNPNFIGAYLVTILPFTFFFKFKIKHINYLISGILIIGIIISGSKAAILALGFILIYLIYKKFKKNKLLLIFFSISCLILTITSISYFIRPSIYDNRTLIWESGINALVDMPITGYGQENFELIFPKELNFKVDNAHNIFLETFLSSGIIGLILFISVIIISFKNANPIIRLSLIALLICGFFNPLFISILILFWILIGTSKKEFNFYL